MKMLIYFCFFQFTLASCILVSPKYLAEGLTVTIIHKDRFESHNETLLQRQIVGGTIHESVPTVYRYPAMNLLQLKTIDGKIYYVDVDAQTFDKIQVNSVVKNKHNWKLITNLPDFKYSKQ